MNKKKSYLTKWKKLNNLDNSDDKTLQGGFSSVASGLNNIIRPDKNKRECDFMGNNCHGANCKAACIP